MDTKWTLTYVAAKKFMFDFPTVINPLLSTIKLTLMNNGRVYMLGRTGPSV